MSGSNFNHTVITSDGAGLVRRAQKEEKKLVFVKAVSSLKFENLRGDLVHKSREWFESIEGTVSAVQAKDGIFQIALSFKQAPSAVTLKSIGVMAKLVGDTDADAVVFAIASDDNAQFVVDTSNTSIVLVMDLPVRINASNCDSYGTIPGGGGGGSGEYVTPSQLEDAIEGCIASGEYDSDSHNIYLKNSDGTILSTIDASDFIVDGMVENVTIEGGNLVISFNTESGKEDIEIPISDIFDASNYYTKDECDQTFLTSSDLEGYALTSEIPTNLSELTNDVGYITSASLPAVNNAALTIKKNSDDVGTTFTANASTDVTANLGLHAVATSGSYTDLTDKPTIPTVNNATLTIQKNGADVSTFTANASSDVTANITVPTNTSDLYNDSDFITSSALSDYALTSSLGSAAYKGVDTSISSSSTDNKVPTSLAVYSYIDAQGFLTQHQSLAGCVASGEYVSADHNILLKNSSGTVLSTIDASAFIKDGMVDTVAISNGYLIITFNTDSGKQPISIPLSDIFDPSNYYTKTQVDSGFMTTGTDQLALTGRKTWASNIREENVIKSSSMSLNPSDVANNVYPSIVLIGEVKDTTTQELTAKSARIQSHGSMSVSYTSSTSDEYEPVPGGGTETYNPSEIHYAATLHADGGSTISAVSATATSVVMEDIENPGHYTLETTEVKNISTLKPNSLKIEQTTEENGVESLAKKTTELNNIHLNIKEDDSSGNTIKYAEFSPSEVEIQYLPGYKEVLLSAENGELVINYNYSGVQHQASLTATAGLSVDSVITAHPTNGFKHQVSPAASSAFASLDHTNGLKLSGGTGTTQLQVTYQAITRGSANYIWNKVPLSFTGAYKNYRIETNENGVGIPHYIPVHIISQIHIKDDEGTLKAAVQVATSGNSGQAWTEYRACARSYHEITNGISPYLQLHFNASDEIDYVQLNSTYGQFYCEFTLLIPQNGSFVTLRGSLYADGLTASQFNLTTPIAVVDDELIIAKAVFTPTWFIAVDPDPAP